MTDQFTRALMLLGGRASVPRSRNFSDCSIHPTTGTAKATWNKLEQNTLNQTHTVNQRKITSTNLNPCSTCRCPQGWTFFNARTLTWRGWRSLLFKNRSSTTICVPRITCPARMQLIPTFKIMKTKGGGGTWKDKRNKGVVMTLVLLLDVSLAASRRSPSLTNDSFPLSILLSAATEDCWHPDHRQSKLDRVLGTQ